MMFNGYYQAINDRLVSNFLVKKNASGPNIGQHLKRVLYYFSYAEASDNEYFNHFAFSQLENYLFHLSQKTDTQNFNAGISLFGLFLQKTTRWKFINAELRRTYDRIDGNCALLLKANSMPIFELLASIAYLEERLSDDISNEVRSQLKDLSASLQHKLMHSPNNKSDFTPKQLEKLTSLTRIFQNESTLPADLLSGLLTKLLEYGADMPGDVSTLIDKSPGMSPNFNATSATTAERLNQLACLVEIKQRNNEIQSVEVIEKSLSSILHDKDFSSTSTTACVDIGMTLLYLQNTRIKDQYYFATLLN